jgi:hypothetical protein
MASVLSLAIKINADASGLKLDPVERALKQLGAETDKVSGIFDKFTATSEAAARAQADTSKALQDLIAARRAGTVSAQEFAQAFETIRDAANAEASALQRAAQITEANLTPIQKYTNAAADLAEQVQAGRITQETYERALAKAKAQLDGTAASASKTDKSIESLTKNVRILSVIEIGRAITDGLQAIGNVITGSLRQISSFASSVANSFDAFNDLSARTGIGVEALQGYSLAAKLAGVDTAEFGAAVQRLSVTIGKATPGDNLDKSLKAINLSVSELRSLSPEQQFSEIGEAISGLPTAADRAAAAVEIFGKQGAALAPLFREGAASIEELRNRADRLGIIVDETQLNNIGSMNDAFDLARATVEGIAGQVIGNLAPAVTAVVDQFLEFIEAFNGTSGTGGNAIADTISRVLLDAADYFAGKFDEFAGYFSSFTVSLDDAGQVFSTVSNVLTTIAESFRAVFNLLQVGVGAITEGFGKLLEGIGSYFSSDLEEYGRNLAAAASEQNRANIAEMEDAATKAAAAFNNALDGGAGSTTAAGEGAASRFMSGVRSRFETEQAPQFKVESNIDDTADRLSRFLSDSNEGASKFLQQSSDTLKVFQQQADAGQLTAGQIQIMNGFMEKLNNELNIELAKRQEIAEAATKQADADAKRVAELTKTSDATAKILEDIAAVERQITAAQAAASATGVDSAGSSSAADRLAELEQLREKLDSQLESAQLGFADGFEAAFGKVGDDLNELGVKANDFGQAGAEAFRLLQEGVQAAKDQVGDGILNREAFEQQVEQQKRVFAQEIENIKAAANERQRVNEFVDKALLEMQFGNDAARGEAAQRAIEIEQEIIRVQEEVQQARKAGDNEALQAGIARIGQLDQVFAKEQDIASGRAKAEEDLRKKQEEQFKQQQKAQEAQQQEAAKAQQKAIEERAKAQEAELKRQAAITRQLNSVGQQSVSGSDIRSTEGASTFIRAAAGQFDPVVAQLRVQTKILNTIAIGIAQNLSQLTGTPAQIGAVRV